MNKLTMNDFKKHFDANFIPMENAVENAPIVWYASMKKAHPLLRGTKDIKKIYAAYEFIGKKVFAIIQTNGNEITDAKGCLMVRDKFMRYYLGVREAAK